MNLQEALRDLEKAGSDSTRKTYVRHGVSGPMFGVSFAALSALKKKIKTDHALARQLWSNGNHDARMLATMICDPAQMNDVDLEAWVNQVENHLLADAVAGVAAQSPGARRKVQQWIGSKDELTSSTGWMACSRIVGKAGAFTAAELDGLLKRIETAIHDAPNRTRYSMNCAVIAIGCLGGDMMRKAIAAAKRIGTVDVDHGDTACETPDAAACIMKVIAHQSGKKKPAAAKSAKASLRSPAATKKKKVKKAALARP